MGEQVKPRKRPRARASTDVMIKRFEKKLARLKKKQKLQELRKQVAELMQLTREYD